MAAALTREEQSWLDRTLAQEEAIETLEEFVQRVSPQIEITKHLKELLDELEGLRLGVALRLLINWPPRHGKTTAVLHAIAWLMCHFKINCGYGAYGDRMARKKSLQIQAMVRAAGLTVEGALDDWSVVETGANLIARGILSPWTGMGCDLLVLDDPIKNREEAESAILRDKTWDSFCDDFSSRLDDPEQGAIIVIHTRWHMDDVAGRILAGRAGEPYKHLLKKAINDNGEALWPRRFPLRVLAIIRAKGEYGWWSLYMQEPRPRGVRVFTEPATFDLGAWKRDGWRIAIAVDPAATAKTQSDWSVAVVLAMRGYGVNCECVILDVLRVQVAIPKFIRMVARLRRHHGRAIPVIVEAIGGFASLPDTFVEICPELAGVVFPVKSTAEVKVTADKFLRAQPVSAAWNDGRVRVPAHSEWVDVFVRECLAFTGTGDAHDDQVDALAHAFNAMYRARPPVKRGARGVQNVMFG